MLGGMRIDIHPTDRILHQTGGGGSRTVAVMRVMLMTALAVMVVHGSSGLSTNPVGALSWA
jgi:hypothetical protein